MNWFILNSIDYEGKRVIVNFSIDNLVFSSGLATLFKKLDDEKGVFAGKKI